MPTAVQSARVQCFLTVTGLFGAEARSVRYGRVLLNPNWPGSAVRQLSAGRSRRSPGRPASGTPVRDVDHHSVGCRQGEDTESVSRRDSDVHLEPVTGVLRNEDAFHLGKVRGVAEEPGRVDADRPDLDPQRGVVEVPSAVGGGAGREAGIGVEGARPSARRGQVEHHPVVTGMPAEPGSGARCHSSRTATPVPLLLSDRPGSWQLRGSPRYPPSRHNYDLSLIHISEPTRLGMISYAVFCL